MELKFNKEIYSSEVQFKPLPINIKEGEERLFGERTYVSPSSRLQLVKKAFVTSDGIIFNGLFPLKKHIVCYQEDFTKYKNRYIVKFWLSPKKIYCPVDEPCIMIYDNYSGPSGFAHWIIDSLTRLVEIKEYLKEYPVIVPYYFNNTDFYNQSLSLFDIKEQYVVKQNTSLFIKNLLVPDHIAPSGNFNHSNLNKLRSYVVSKVNKGYNKGKNIYISRSGATRRYVINEAEVENFLIKKGFQIVHMEDHSFTEQVSIVANAENVVSIHGAALALIAFMKKGSKVMEFRKKNDSHNNVFYALACAASVNYFYQTCEFIEISKSANNFNLKVDINTLKNDIELMLHYTDVKP